MASTDARPVPKKNIAYRVYLPIYDADGDLVTGAAGLDSEVSKDGGNYADCTNEATEIQSTGTYFLDLTSTEMDADCVVVIVKTSTVGAKTTPIFLYPEEAGDIRVDVTSFGGTAGTFSGGRAEVNLSHWKGSAPDDLIAGHVQADMQAALDGVLTASKFADGFLTAAKVATGAIDADALAADAVTEIQSGLATAAALDAVDNFVDTEITAIIAALVTLDGKVDVIDGIVDSITARLPAALVGGRMASNAEVVGDKADYALSTAGQAAVADKLLGRTRAGGADGGRTVAQCLAMGRNRSEIVAGVLTVYADDDATPLWTAVVSTAPGDPITGIDPA